MKNCIECGYEIDEDANHCKKCGAKQVVEKKPPRGGKKQGPPKPQEEDEDDEHDDKGDTGSKHSADQAERDMDKVSSRAIKEAIDPAYHGAYNAIVGGGTIVGSLIGAKKLHKAMKPKNPPPRRGMVRTAAAKKKGSRRRSINPVYNIRKGKKHKVLRAFLGKTDR